MSNRQLYLNPKQYNTNATNAIHSDTGLVIHEKLPFTVDFFS